MTVRVRFAPSPTGFMHLGNARTALFNWLFARHVGGKFLLRIEDTDRERSTDEAVQVIFNSLKWLGFDWDEEVVFQTQRLDRYQEIAQQLLDQGHAYKCFCTKEELAEMKERMKAETGWSRYDRTWRDREDQPEGQPYTIRFKTPLEGSSAFDDIIQGSIRKGLDELDDFIMVRSDGIPTYQFAVDMAITHVIRGVDHIDNTHDQISIYKALGWTPPRFSHAPYILGLSKRKGSPSVEYFRDEIGILREALINYLVRLGWSHGDQEIFSTDELFKLFDIADVNRSNGQFDDDKLRWVNEQHLRSQPLAELDEAVRPFFEKAGYTPRSDEWFHRLLDALRPRASYVHDLVEQSSYFFTDFDAYDAKAAKKHLKMSMAPILGELADRIEALEEWSTESIGAAYVGLCEAHEMKLGKIAQPSRVALTGVGQAPGIYEIVWLLGKDCAVKRLRAAGEWIKANRG